MAADEITLTAEEVLEITTLFSNLADWLDEWDEIMNGRGETEVRVGPEHAAFMLARFADAQAYDLLDRLNGPPPLDG